MEVATGSLKELLDGSLVDKPCDLPNHEIDVGSRYVTRLPLLQPQMIQQKHHASADNLFEYIDDGSLL